MRLAVCLLLLCCCFFDYCSRRIPNRLIVLLGVVLILNTAYLSGTEGCLLFVLRAALMVIAAGPLYAVGVFGAGDVKLLAVICGSLTGGELSVFLGVSLLAAAGASVGKLLFFRSLRTRLGVFLAYSRACALEGRLLPYPEGLQDRRNTVCLAGPILLGYLAAVGGRLI